MFNLVKRFAYFSTVVSAFIPPGYKPTSAPVPPKDVPDCFC